MYDIGPESCITLKEKIEQADLLFVWGTAGMIADACMCSTVLYCTVLYCTVLYCTVLYCTVLYCTVLYYTVLFCVVRTVRHDLTLNVSHRCD